MDEREADQQLLQDVQEVGWHVLLIPEDEEGPAFAFTVGLYHSFQHPEVLIMGLDPGIMHRILNIIGEDAKAGRHYEPEKEYPDILEGYRCAFEEIDKGLYEEYLGYAIWFYRGSAFPALQCVWPDHEGRYPWD